MRKLGIFVNRNTQEHLVQVLANVTCKKFNHNDIKLDVSNRFIPLTENNNIKNN